MANKHRGEVAWKVGKKTYTLQVKTAGHIAFEASYGESLLKWAYGLRPRYRVATQADYEGWDSNLRLQISANGQEPAYRIADPEIPTMTALRALLGVALIPHHGRMPTEAIEALMDQAGYEGCLIAMGALILTIFPGRGDTGAQEQGEITTDADPFET